MQETGAKRIGEEITKCYTWPDEEDDGLMVSYSPSFSQAIMDLFLGKGII